MTITNGSENFWENYPIRRTQTLRWMTGDRISGFARIYDAERKKASYLVKYVLRVGPA